MGIANMEKSKITNVEDMPVYQAFFGLALEVERITIDCKSEFRWLRGQALRSSESVCANMAEGFFSQYSTEYVQALYRCRREAYETITHLRYAARVAQLHADAVNGIVCHYNGALQQLANLIASIERKITERGKSKINSVSKSS